MANSSLTAQLQRLQTLGVAPSTRRTYQAGITQFRSFCSQYHLPFLPASSLTLRYFCAHLSTRVKHSTIKLYLSALRLLHIENGFPDPTDDTLLQYVVKGVKRSQSTSTRPRLPITLQLLRNLKQALHDSHSTTTPDKRMLWAAFCTAFFGFLRASEFCTVTAHSFDSSRSLCRADLSLTPSLAQLVIKASKTDPFRRSCTVTVGATHTSTCPVSALEKYLALANHPPHSPLFQFQDGSYLTRPTLTAHLRSLLQSAGSDPSTFASHSFRIGAATTPAAAGLPDWQIQAMGRWSSDCYTRYIHTSPTTIAAASVALASGTHTQTTAGH